MLVHYLQLDSPLSWSGLVLAPPYRDTQLVNNNLDFIFRSHRNDI